MPTLGGKKSIFIHCGGIGYANILLNQPEEAIKKLDKGTRKDVLDASWCGIVYPLTILSEALRMVGKLESVNEAINRALKYAHDREEKGWGAWAMLAKAKNQSDMGDNQQAKKWCLRGITSA